MDPGDEWPMHGPRRPSHLVRAHPVAAFYLLLLALTWPVMIAARDSVLTYVMMTVLGPSICALAVVGVAGGGNAVVAQLRRVLAWRAPVWAWLYAAAGNGLLVAGAAVSVIYIWHGGGLDWRWAPLAITLAVNLVVLLVVPGLAEEIGWRGLALPHLQDRQGPVVASLAVGMLWALWHYPLWIAENGGVTMSLFWVTLGVIGASFAYTWLHNASGGSVLLAIVLHAGENAWTGHAFEMLVGDQYDLAFVVRQVAAAAIALVLVLATKGRLGLPGDEHDHGGR